MKIDEELARGCERYLAELKRRSAILEREKAELREAEAQRKVRREQWRKVLYGSHGTYLTFVVPEGSRLHAE